MLTARKQKEVRELAEKSRARREAGLYIAEGPRTCELLDASDVQEVFVTQDFLDSSSSLRCRDLAVRAVVVSGPEMRKLSDTMTPQGILAVVRMPESKKLSQLLGPEQSTALLLILETIQDPGNLGTILRAAEAAGCTGILMDEKTVDPFSPKVVRSSMGSLFRMPLRMTHTLREEVHMLRLCSGAGGRNIRVFATSPSAAEDYCNADFKRPCGIMIGNEAAGLSEDLMREADERITIPMQGRIESLNAAMALSVIAFEAARQRRL